MLTIERKYTCICGTVYSVCVRANDVIFVVDVGFHDTHTIYLCLNTFTHSTHTANTDITESWERDISYRVSMDNAWRQRNKALYFFHFILVLRSMLLSLVVYPHFIADFLFPDLGVLFYWFSHFWNAKLFFFSSDWIELHFKSMP